MSPFLAAAPTMADAVTAITAVLAEPTVAGVLVIGIGYVGVNFVLRVAKRFMR